MTITVKLRQLKIAARKVRLAADLIRYKSVTEAESILRFTPKKAAAPLLKLLQSAMAAAKNTHQSDPKDFFVAKITVDDGPMQKRVFPRSRGRADRIEKRTSHITLALDKKSQDEKSEIGEKKAKAKIKA
jgi:large subunit ribosomal protein L22